MANEEQLAMVEQGVRVWNEWRWENLGLAIDLSGAYLRNADLREANFGGVDLRGADIVGANFRGANLSVANLGGANFGGADLKDADLRGADIGGAHFGDADLRAVDLSIANLKGTDLSGANLRLAQIGDTTFVDLDLSKTIGLEAVRHGSPSTIGTNTLLRSQGKIPDAFLRGCGLSDWEIEAVKLYNPDLSNDERDRVLYKIHDLQASQSIQVSPLFISYSHADSAFADKIGERLTSQGIRYWRDIHEMKAGRIEKQIDHAIRQNPTVLLILSKNSINSDWVEHEVRMARTLEKELERDLFCPVALDDSWKQSRWPQRLVEQIMEYNILDFSAWQDDDRFDGTFRKLIDGLQLFYER